MVDLDARILAAHAVGDGRALVKLYAKAAEVAGDCDRRSFFLTHALVFALETGHPDAPDLRRKLRDMGREQ